MKSRATSLPDAPARLALRVCLWACALALSGTWAADTGVAIEHLHVEQPRTFGFQLGDQFERKLRLRLRHPYELVPESFPPPGRLNRWIAFHSYDVDKRTTGGADDYAITLRYQVVNVEPEATDAGVPGHLLEVRNGDETLSFQVRPSRTVITPFGKAVSNDLAADIAPAPLPGRRNALALFGAILAVSSMAFAALHFGWFRGGPGRPFARAHRHLRGYRQEPLSDEAYGAALRAVHEAFNHTAGHTLFAEQLDGFFDEHPGFARLESGIVEFFERSNTYFFADASERLTLDELRALAKQCRDVERGLA